ncbi:MarR family transcriptional regulator [Crossiella sp. CA-258035]|uniref:MarR family winged helix-turn-helix transcriptional regulator n=1 Tax=Crossiella sp. CA-258035 TaxID=2981138 RepID=UPI0024BCB95D|nr:MarR family transcriptional regulator [Crossiella sp. CA-258035]WHT23285.1 MarR family transcriptional regulator [Crossiella sp. CA-258035]
MTPSDALTEVTELLEVLWERGGGPSLAPLSVSQLRALYVLERAGCLNLRELGEALGSTPPSISRLCDRLQAVGFVARTPSSVSRREVELRITETGLAYLGELRAQRRAQLAEVLDAMPASARRSLHTGLSQFLAAADKVAGTRFTTPLERGTETA